MVLKTVAVLGAASLALAACSSDSGDTETSAATEETSAEATAEETAKKQLMQLLARTQP
jgi:ABC-type glycerol-3-phosphate transport system substrate-binding protein